MGLHTELVKVHNGHVVVVAQDKKDATTEQWAVALGHVKEAIALENGDMSRVAGLVISDGGAPNVAQRAGMKEVLANRPFRICVATDLAVVRVVVGIMSWFNKEMKVTAPFEIAHWLAHARVRPEESELVWKAMWKQQARLGGLSTAAKMEKVLHGDVRASA